MVLRVLLCQAPSIVGDVQANLKTMEDFIQRNANEADVSIFPECFISGYGSIFDESNGGCDLSMQSGTILLEKYVCVC